MVRSCKLLRMVVVQSRKVLMTVVVQSHKMSLKVVVVEQSRKPPTMVAAAALLSLWLGSHD